MLLGLPQAGHADDWPSRPIRLIVTFPAGGPSDLLARSIGAKLSEAVKQPVVIDNRPGASGLIGNDVVAKAAPDGYTLGMPSAGSMSIVPNLTKLPYNRDKDLMPLTVVANAPQVVVVNPKRVQAANLKDLLALAKEKPGVINCGSTGNGSPNHLMLERMKQLTGADIAHVPYRGAAPAVNDILGGQIDMLASDVAAVLPHLRAGTLRAIAITSDARISVLPDVPTFAEAGVPGVDMVNWYVLVGPGGLPAPLAAQIHDAVASVLRDEEIKTRLAGQGLLLTSTTLAETLPFVQAETKKWGDVAHTANVRMDD
jgi:tripartite-type tricarboxylate transporter receptor subunit TctC